MNEENNLESARTRYIISEAERDMIDALKNEDYQSAKVYADGAYDMLYRLYEQETDGEEKSLMRIKLRKLSDIVDEISGRLNLGNTGEQNDKPTN